MYSKNITTFFKHLYPRANATPDFTDEIIAGSCITRNGAIVNEQVKAAFD
jgi:NAD/NADP transhydrogenase alpha subunit